jgi:GNAT superfamily N-acetyltransferase
VASLPVEFEPCSPTESPAAELLDEMVEEMRALYNIAGPNVGVPLEPSELGPPAGVYLVGRVGGDVAAGGGLRLLSPEMAEIKRMYVRPAFRSRGLARSLLGALEREAHLLGAQIVRLDTGAKQPHARTLYERSGYVSIVNWNQNPDAAFWGEKRLS